ncbi:MAG: metallo-mystery pair system four-Cys motif protein [Deltaproteobacteria bacterium]|nr:metallo-mystery pair system four-Cys motif protein [Deltaproteobacteria bacterium]
MILRNLTLAPLALALALPLTAASCSDDGGGSSGDATTAVAVKFAGYVNGEDFACDKTFAHVGASDSTIAPLDFRFYVSDVKLVDAAGAEHAVTLDADGKWQDGEVALVDLEDKSGTCANGTTDVNTTIKGMVTAPKGTDFTGLRFTLGVPFDENHSDAATAASPLDLSGMFWSWQGGRKFLRIDSKLDGSANGYNVHIGSTGCELDATTQEVSTCSAPNRAVIDIADYDMATDTIAVDYGAIVAGLDLTADGGGAPGCMSGKDDPECGMVFDHLGIDLTTGSPKAGQTAFSAK